MSDNTIQTEQKRKVEKEASRAPLYLTEHQVNTLLALAKRTRNPDRDQALILITYRHGLRASEATNLSWQDVDLEARTITVHRGKGSTDSTQKLERDELRLLRKLADKRDAIHIKKDGSIRTWDKEMVFVGETGQAMNRDNFLKLMTALGKKAGLKDCHPHMLRHAAGFALANAQVPTRTIQGFLGHKNIAHTQHYTDMAASVYAGLGRKIGGKV